MQSHFNAGSSYITQCSENNRYDQQAIVFKTSTNAPLTKQTVVQCQHKVTTFKDSWSADSRGGAAKIYQEITTTVSSLL